MARPDYDEAGVPRGPTAAPALPATAPAVEALPELLAALKVQRAWRVPFWRLRDQDVCTPFHRDSGVSS